ncbi:MAG: MBL fold metallo-hydrolase, partial [Candidatus Aenigmarchaeota archaeon]|nr:MBL fold metallo-hydrolase [Candidatus Aenigmarchaeota archaeon]
EVGRRLKEGDAVRADDMGFEVMHTPGHTPGSICLYDRKSKTLITGDTIFSDGVGRTDMPGGNEEQLKESIDKLASLEVRRLLPGHGDALVCDSPRTVADIMSGPSESGEEED